MLQGPALGGLGTGGGHGIGAGRYRSPGQAPAPPIGQAHLVSLDGQAGAEGQPQPHVAHVHDGAEAPPCRLAAPPLGLPGSTSSRYPR